MLTNFLDWNAERKDTLAALKKEKEPLIIWGRGEVAQRVQNLLEENDIKASCFCEDACKQEEKYLSLPVLSWEMVQERYAHFNVILGHSRYQMGLFLKEKLGTQVKKIFYVHNPIYDVGFFDKNAIEQDLKEYQIAYDRLADEKSKRNMVAFLNTGMTGDMKYIFSEFHQHMDLFHNELYTIGRWETYWDVGAFNGDTVRQFRMVCCDKYKQIVAIEPDQENFTELRKYTGTEKINRITLVQSGVWEKSGEMLFQAGRQQKSAIIQEGEDNDLEEKGCVKVSVQSLDDIAAQINIKEATLLKYNYYPYVAKGIKGAKKLIQENHPAIVARVGFDRMSVVEVVNEISNITNDYKIYLRFNDAMMSALMLYAV